MFYRNVCHLASRCRQGSQLDAFIQVIAVTIEKPIVLLLIVDAGLIVSGGACVMVRCMIWPHAIATAASMQLVTLVLVIAAAVVSGCGGVAVADQGGSFAKFRKQLIVRSE